MTQIFKKPVVLVLTAALTFAAFGTTAVAADNGAAPQASTVQTFDQNRIDPTLYAHQTVGNPYTVAGQTYYPAHNPGYDIVGAASWYGAKFQGKLTASGERFDRHAMTAAHKTLPLNSLVVVTSLTTGQAITVRINDRGPFIGGGVIDLSEAAAASLGAGFGHVRVQYAGPAQPVVQSAPRTQAKTIMPQVSLPAEPIAAPEAYAHNNRANSEFETLTVKGPVHMASHTDAAPKARLIRAVYRRTYKS